MFIFSNRSTTRLMRLASSSSRWKTANWLGSMASSHYQDWSSSKRATTFRSSLLVSGASFTFVHLLPPVLLTPNSTASSLHHSQVTSRSRRKFWIGSSTRRTQCWTASKRSMPACCANSSTLPTIWPSISVSIEMILLVWEGV